MTASRGEHSHQTPLVTTAGWGILAAMFLVPLTPQLSGGWGRMGIVELLAAYVLAFVYASPVWLVLGALGGAFIGWRVRRGGRVVWLEIAVAGAAAGVAVYEVFGDLPFALGESGVHGRDALPLLAGAGSFYALMMFVLIRRMSARR